MSSQSLSSSLRSLEESQKRISNLINQLAKNSRGQSSRADVSSEIHELLQEQSDHLELLRQDVNEVSSHRVGGGSGARLREEKEQENERNVSTFTRLEEDIKIAHRNFRRAQVDAKRAEDNARRQEREELFAKRRKDGEGVPPSNRQGMNLTQDELAINAANDVTKSLRRTHALLESNLEQSQFAIQTLEESSQALAGLGEKYSGMDGLLKTSRGLLSQLYRSQKSDTWYLETAFYILLATITWLVFRRLVYGPAWWLIWLPLKMLWRTCSMLMGAMGLALSSSPGTNLTQSSFDQAARSSRPTLNPAAFHSVEVKAKGGGWGQPAQPPGQNEGSMVEKIGRMIEDSKHRVGLATEPDGDESTLDDDEEPEILEGRNPKKRMMELEKEQERLRDEL